MISSLNRSIRIQLTKKNYNNNKDTDHPTLLWPNEPTFGARDSNNNNKLINRSPNHFAVVYFYMCHTFWHKEFFLPLRMDAFRSVTYSQMCVLFLFLLNDLCLLFCHQIKIKQILSSCFFIVFILVDCCKCC